MPLAQNHREVTATDTTEDRGRLRIRKTSSVAGAESSGEAMAMSSTASTADSVPGVITTGFKAVTNLESFFRGTNMKKGKLLRESGRVYDVKEVRFDGQVDVTERRTPLTKLSVPAKKCSWR
ncbi:hypothetical protein ISCGN_003084 [Ixodes scapularis]